MKLENYKKLRLLTPRHIDVYAVHETHYLFEPQEICHYYKSNKTGGEDLFIKLKARDENGKQIIETIKFDDDHLTPYELLEDESN